MNYVIAILADRIQAEAAYGALEKEQLPMNGINIVGKGYKSAEDYDFLDPAKQARKQALFMAYWLIPFGFVGGYTFNSITSFNLVPAAGILGNHLIGALLGAVAGAMGSFFVGGGANLLFGSGDAVPYQKHLNEGKYLVIVNGPPNVTNQATRVLRQFKPENLQAYVDPNNP